MSRIWLTSIVSFLIAFTPALAAEPSEKGQATQATLDVLLDAVRANRKALVAASLDLTDEEAVKFWPLYDRYQIDLNKNGDRLVAVVEDYTENFSALSDDKALAIVQEYLAVEGARNEVRSSYLGEFEAVLPGRKIARFYQIENKVDALIRYDLAANIPVIGETEAAP